MKKRRMGYKEIASGNIRDCLYSDTDYSTWYVDRLGDLRCDAIHHDGTNHYLYRTYKPGVRQSQIDNLKEKLYFGTATRSDITRITRRLGDEIAKVYGFSIPRQRQAQAVRIGFHGYPKYQNSISAGSVPLHPRQRRQCLLLHG